MFLAMINFFKGKGDNERKKEGNNNSAGEKKATTYVEMVKSKRKEVVEASSSRKNSLQTAFKKSIGPSQKEKRPRIKVGE